jgi:hypothetical protein
MEKILETTLGILESREDGLDFVDLARAVTAEAQVDEATAKASILRLSFEGKLRIDLDWSVHPVAALHLVVAA